jgi:competence protein ComEA
VKLSRFINGWTVAAFLLAVIIIAGGVVIWSKQSRNQPIEISAPPAPGLPVKVYVGGEVNNPGFYPLKDGDSIEDLLRAAGGLADGADLKNVEIAVSFPEEGDSPQKIDINRAEAWLLAALPGIGEVKAQAIVDYRDRNGPFRDIYELTKVDGFGDVTLERIKYLITVADSY